jgi:hypothetical protein
MSDTDVNLHTGYPPVYIWKEMTKAQRREFIEIAMETARAQRRMLKVVEREMA